MHTGPSQYFTKHTPEQNIEKRSGPGAPPSPIAGILEASPPRNGEKVPELFRPARTHPCWQPPHRRERITWLRTGIGRCLRLGGRETAVASAADHSGHGGSCVIALIKKPPEIRLAPPVPKLRIAPSSPLVTMAGQRKRPGCEALEQMRPAHPIRLALHRRQ
jgi:hypothetical protein